MTRVIVREALPGEMGAAGALRVAAYQAQGFLAAGSDYADTLRGLGADGHGTVLVAVEDRDLLGTVMLEPWHADSEVARGADEAEMRAFAVSPAAQRRGIGRALIRAAIAEARARGARRLVLSTQPAMTAAQRLYQEEGFTRLPERDWAPVPGLTLLAYALPLSPR